MAGSNGNNYIALAMGLDVTDLRAGVREAKKQLSDIETEFEKTTASMDNWRKSQQGLEARLDSLKKKLQTQKSIIDGYRAEIEHLEKSEGDHTAEIIRLNAQLDKAEIAYRKTQKSIGYYTRQLKTITNETKELSQAQTQVNVTTQVLNKGFTVLKGVLSNLATDAIRNVVQGFKDMLNAGIEFESSFADVRKTVDASEEELAQLELSIRRMARELPQSASAIAEVASQAGQLGISTEDIMEFTRVMIMLGDSTNLSSTEASDALARFANITGMSAENYQRLGSAVVDLGNKFATTESEIVDMSRRIAGAGVQVGLTEPEILSLATALSSVGIEAEMGGSAISRVLIDMSVAVETQSELLEQYAKVAGQTTEEFSEAFKKNALDGLSAFINGLDAIDKSGGSVLVTLEEMGIKQIRERDTVLRLVSANELLSRAIEVGNEAWEENTALVTEATTRYKTTESQLQLMKNAWNELGLEIYDNLRPALNSIFGLLTDIAEAFTGNVDAGSTLVTAVTNLNTALENYKTAQENAKKATDDTTEAMVLQAEQAVRTSILSAASAYMEAINEIDRLNKEVLDHTDYKEEMERAIQDMIVDTGNAQNIDMTDLYRQLEIYGGATSSEDASQAMYKLVDMGFSQQDLPYLLDYYETWREEIDKVAEANRALDTTYSEVQEGMNLAFEGVKSGIVTMDDISNVSITFADAVNELGASYQKGVDDISEWMPYLEDNEQALTETVAQLKLMQKETSAGTSEYAYLAGKISVATEALRKFNQEASGTSGSSGGAGGTGGGGESAGGSGGGSGSTDKNSPESIQADMNIDVSVAQKMAQVMGTSADELNRELLRIYENALRRLLAGGASLSDDIVQDVIAQIKDIKGKLPSGGSSSSRGSIFEGLWNAEGFTEELQASVEKVKSAYDEIANYVSGVFDSIGDIVSGSFQLQLDAIEEKLEELDEATEEYMNEIDATANRQIALLNAQYEEGAISEEEYYKRSAEEQQKSLKKKTDAEQQAETKRQELERQKDEMARKQFEANKLNQIAQVWIALGSAIMTTYAQSGWILGTIFSALLTAQAGVQTAIIASQKYTPAMAKGGIVDDPTLALVGEAGKEAVLPLENNTEWIRELAGQLESAMNAGTTGARENNIDNSRTNTFNQVINSPKALTRKEIYRETRELLRIAGRTR